MSDEKPTNDEELSKEIENSKSNLLYELTNFTHLIEEIEFDDINVDNILKRIHREVDTLKKLTYD